MNLEQAVRLVWYDVADCVLRDPTAAEAIDYARNDITPVELQYILDDQRAGRYAPGSDVEGDVYGAYVDVRNANVDDVTKIVNDIDQG